MTSAVHSGWSRSRIATASRDPQGPHLLATVRSPPHFGATPGRGLVRCRRPLLLHPRSAAASEGPASADVVQPAGGVPSPGGDGSGSGGLPRGPPGDGSAGRSAAVPALEEAVEALQDAARQLFSQRQVRPEEQQRQPHGPAVPTRVTPEVEEAVRLAQEAVMQLHDVQWQYNYYYLLDQFQHYPGDSTEYHANKLSSDAELVSAAVVRKQAEALRSLSLNESRLRSALAAVTHYEGLRRAALAEASRLEVLQQTATVAVLRAEAVLAAAQEAGPRVDAAPQSRGLRGEVERAVTGAEDIRQKALEAHADLELARQAALGTAAAGHDVRQRALELVAAAYGRRPEEMEEFLAANTSRPSAGAELGQEPSPGNLDRAALEAAARLEATGGDPSEYLLRHRREMEKGDEKVEEVEEEEEEEVDHQEVLAAIADGGQAPGGDPSYGSGSSSSSASAVATDPQEARRLAQEAADRVSTLRQLLPPHAEMQRLRSEARKAAARSQRATASAAKAVEKANSALLSAQKAALRNETLRKRMLLELSRVEAQRHNATEAVERAEATMVQAHKAAPVVQGLVAVLGLPLDAETEAAATAAVDNAADKGEEGDEGRSGAAGGEGDAGAAGAGSFRADSWAREPTREERQQAIELFDVIKQAKYLQGMVQRLRGDLRRVQQQQQQQQQQQRGAAAAAPAEGTVMAAAERSEARDTDGGNRLALNARVAAVQEAVVEELARAEAVLDAVAQSGAFLKVLGHARNLRAYVWYATTWAAAMRRAGLQVYERSGPLVQSLHETIGCVEGVRERALEVLAAAQGVAQEEVPGFLAANAFRPTVTELDREALEAVAYAEGLRGKDVERYLARHTYRCRNGHTYFVAGCGNPAQASTCPICQAPVGSGSGDSRIGYPGSPAVGG